MIGTVIISNGSKMAGAPPDTVDALIALLERYPLDRFFKYHFMKSRADGAVRFHGNFLTLSHVFDIHSDDPDVIERLTSAIVRMQHAGIPRPANSRPAVAGDLPGEERGRRGGERPRGA